MNEIETLLQRADKTIKSAELLLNERDFDGSLSRSYYAMFYTAEAALLKKNLKFSSHKSVISLFGQHFVKTGLFKPEMGKRLSKTFENRLIGDYSYSSEITKESAEEAIKWAKEFIKEIKDHLKTEKIE